MLCRKKLNRTSTSTEEVESSREDGELKRGKIFKELSFIGLENYRVEGCLKSWID